ncbi:MAG: 50S ribosomal protein L17 [bacterium]|nr:50S ribosomal protein L17 [bacterium]
MKGHGRSHRLSILKSLLTSLIIYEKISTTKSTAKVLKEYADKFFSRLFKKDGVEFTRYALRYVNDKVAFEKLQTLKNRFNRNYGFVRIFRNGIRKGDGSRIYILKLV